jgi:hypothetical protein
MSKLTLKVKACKHPNAVNIDNPSVVREIGFKVTTTLTSDVPASSTLQEKYKLVQYVTDKYWLQTRDTDTSTVWVDGGWNTTAWERDQFGKDDDQGEWNSTQSETTFYDEPGFLGTQGQHARALNKRQRLGYYEISFKWKVYDGGILLKETEVITLKADPDNSNNIAYTPDINKTWSIDV